MAYHERRLQLWISTQINYRKPHFAHLWYRTSLVCQWFRKKSINHKISSDRKPVPKVATFLNHSKSQIIKCRIFLKHMFTWSSSNESHLDKQAKWPTIGRAKELPHHILSWLQHLSWKSPSTIEATLPPIQLPFTTPS